MTDNKENVTTTKTTQSHEENTNKKTEYRDPYWWYVPLGIALCILCAIGIIAYSVKWTENNQGAPLYHLTGEVIETSAEGDGQQVTFKISDTESVKFHICARDGAFRTGDKISIDVKPFSRKLESERIDDITSDYQYEGLCTHELKTSSIDRKYDCSGRYYPQEQPIANE